MDCYRRRIAMLSVGAQLGCPVRRRIVDLGGAGEHRDLYLGVAQRISPGQPPASAVPRGIFRQTQRWYTTNDVR
jgi:hypothetical protein